MLAVGTGLGEVDHDFLDEIVRRRKAELNEYSVVYQVVEPNSNSIKFFRNSVLKNDNYSRINFQWYHGFLEDFTTEFIKKENGVMKGKSNTTLYIMCNAFITLIVCQL